MTWFDAVLSFLLFNKILVTLVLVVRYIPGQQTCEAHHPPSVFELLECSTDASFHLVF